MKTGWQNATIADTCEVVNGGTPKTGVAAYWGGKHMWITPAEMGGRSDPYVGETERQLTDRGLEAANLLPRHSVILSSRAPIGHIVINTVPMATNQGCKGLVPKPGVDHKYLYYYLSSIVGSLNELGTGATFKELSGGKLKEVPIPLASLPEQQRIVAILDETFAGLAAASANAKKNLKNARELFDGCLQSAFDARREQLPLLALATEITDGDHSPPPKAASGVPFITISNIVKESLEIDFDNTFFVPREYFESLKPNKRPKVGDILYTVTGATLGIPVLVRDQKEFCFQRHIALIRPKIDVDSSWLIYGLASPYVFAQATIGSTGAAQKTVSLKVLRNMTVPKLNLIEQQATARKLDDLAERTRRLAIIYRRKIQSLVVLRQAILKKAFSGELTSPPPQAIKEAAE